VLPPLFAAVQLFRNEDNVDGSDAAKKDSPQRKKLGQTGEVEFWGLCQVANTKEKPLCSWSSPTIKKRP